MKIRWQFERTKLEWRSFIDDEALCTEFYITGTFSPKGAPYFYVMSEKQTDLVHACGTFTEAQQVAEKEINRSRLI